MRVAELRQKHPLFAFRDFTWEETSHKLRIEYLYHIDPHFLFTHQLTLDFPEKIQHLPPSFIDTLVFHLGLAELFSYWKLTCSPRIKIEPLQLTSHQIAWWDKLLMYGMGEYFYQNQIDFAPIDFVEWETTSTKSFLPFSFAARDAYVLMWGGGKDSAVATELLKSGNKKITPLWVNPLTNKNAFLKAARLSALIEVERTFDPLLGQLNTQGYLNGHVPFSASLAFIALLSAALLKQKHIVVANEKSADEANTWFRDREINHQYSKTYQFEKDFNSYVYEFITPEIDYFSILRPLYELQIGQLFSQYPDYFSVFNSCNKFRQLGHWCGVCPKCLSVFLSLAPFIGISKMNQIMGSNLLENTQLLPLYKGLLGLTQPKPFECVATYEETKVASYLLTKNFTKDKQLPQLLKFFSDIMMSKENDWEKRTHKLLTQWTDEHRIPNELVTFREVFNSP